MPGDHWPCQCQDALADAHQGAGAMRQRSGFQLPAPRGFFGSTVSWIDAAGAPHSRSVGPSLLSESMGSNRVSRRPTSHPLRRNTEGFYWFGQLGHHVWYESMEEYTALMRLDHRCRVTAIVTQPMRIDFAGGGAHFPDIFLEYADGRQGLCNVRPAALIDDAAAQQFEQTALVCSEIGWSHQVLPEVSRIERHNLEWLAAYRHPRHAPTAAGRMDILHAAQSGGTFGDLWSESRTLREAHPLAGLYHLLWRRDLDFDATRPLDFDTPIRKAAA